MPIRPLAIDVFSGVGGMSLGFEQAGFNVAAAFDIESFNIDSYRRNFPDSKAFVTDLSKESGDSIRSSASIGSREIDVVFGGPPCQGFSVGGKRDLDDERNLLVYDFARLVRELEPRYFVLENVRGLTYAHAQPVLKSLCYRLKRAGYQISSPPKILNAQDFGVPQRRHRVFIVGCRKGLPLPATPSRFGCVDERGVEFFPTVKDAISDLPKIERYGFLFEQDFLPSYTRKARSAYAQLMRGELVCPYDCSKRYSDENTPLTGCLRTRHSPETIKRFEDTPPGKAEPVSRYFRLSWSDVAPTIRAGTGVDHGKHTAPRPIHPDCPRCITSREAARLHSFPDWFTFHGTRWHDFRQIGNSVPPLLARAVAREIVKVLC